jgi:hypothetical protein
VSLPQLRCSAVHCAPVTADATVPPGPHGPAAGVPAETWFSAEARSARNARHLVRRCLADADVRAIEEIELLTGELFAEAAAAAEGMGRVCVRIREADGRLRIEVAREPTPDATPLDSRDPLETAILERLLDAFALRWGRTAGASGDVAVWFELARTAPRPVDVDINRESVHRRVDARGTRLSVTKD